MKTTTRKTISLLALMLLLGPATALRAAVFAKANWVGLGSGLGGTVSALAVDTNGNLYAGGVFTNAGTLSVNHIAEWNGTAWLALGSGASNGVNGQVLALALDTNRNILYVGGTFSTAGGVAASNIAKWNGNSWTNLGSGMNGQVNALAVDTNGNLFAGGSFSSPCTNNSHYGAIWNGTNWLCAGTAVFDGSVPDPLTGPIFALVVSRTNKVYAGGSFTNGIYQSGHTAGLFDYLNGTTNWTLVGSEGITTDFAQSSVKALAYDKSSDTVYAGGIFSSLNTGAQADWVVRSVSGGAPVAAGSSGFTESAGAVSALAVDSFGGLYAGHIGIIFGLDEWTGGTAWSGIIDSGMTNGNVNALVFDGSGNLYAGGSFTTAGGGTVNFIAEAKPAPTMAVQQPVGTNLMNGSASIDFGTLNAAGSSNVTFTVLNPGYRNLTLGAITTDGANPGDFTLNTNAMLTTVAPNGTATNSTTFTVTFAPTTNGARSAAIHIANNDTNNNPFTINLTGTGNQQILVQQPVGTNLVNGGVFGFGNVAVGSTNLTFTIQNGGGFNLTLGSITTDGANPGDFALNTNAMLTSLAPGSNTTFSLTFSPPTSGPFSAAIHIANNVTTANPFNVNLTGFGYYSEAQYDSNYTAGVNSGTSAGITIVTNNPNAYNLYTTNQIEALNLPVPLIQRNTNGTFTLIIGVQKSTNLVNFLAFPMTAPQTSIDGQGNLDFTFTVPDNAAFFRLQAQ